MDHLDSWEGVDIDAFIDEHFDREVCDAMSADLDLYMALSAQYCKCEALCTCDDSKWLAAARDPVTVNLA